MDPAALVEYIMKLGFTGGCVAALVICYIRMDRAEKAYDALQEKRIEEKDALLKRLTHQEGA